ncbi:OmpA family protein [Mangrovibacterium marinum]|uniref:OmpA family protein n=1 Tax=Mangrovibacterium marinum TaxID=1639118 RepID=UPI002A18D6A3|nr:OmpA family protein [Mangrovibacterium marinum]
MTKKPLAYPTTMNRRSGLLNFLLLILLFVLPLGGHSQSKKALKYFDEAKSLYRNSDFQQVLERLKYVVRQEPNWIEPVLLQADAYGETDSLDARVNALEKALDIDDEKYPRVFFLLGNARYQQGEYCLASRAYQRFLDTGRAARLESEVHRKIAACDYAAQLVAQEVPFAAVNLGDSVNTPMNEYWPSLTIDGKKLVFTRLLPVENRTSPLSPRFQEDFYQSDWQEGAWRKAHPLATVNTADNEGAQSISADGRLLFFTACHRPDSYGGCDLYFSRLQNGQWTAPQNAGSPVNTGAWESQPSISANGEYLYFVSTREGGKGGRDIWRCRLEGFRADGRPIWDEPENLGDSINTVGNEVSPFIHSDGKSLYFASDTWPGLGDKDLFVAKMKTDASWTSPQNLGYPINTVNEEKGLVVDASGTYAYYSSNREKSKGLDIYRFKLYEAIQPDAVSYVAGVVYDKSSGMPLSARVELIDLGNNSLITKTEASPPKGDFMICLPLGEEYAFNVTMPGYLFYSANFALKEVHKLENPVELEIGLEPITPGGKTVLRNIFFKTDSYALESQSQVELKKLLEFMRQNPNVSVEIGGHTDGVGTADYNQLLSENRAKAVYDYLIGAGISASRLAYKGYGFTVPVADNTTDEGRALNRRTEFKVLEYTR